MAAKKRRSDIAKLVSAARNVWRQSENYQIVKKRCKDPNNTGWFICEKCKEKREVIKIDHVEPVGKQPDSLLEFGKWLGRLFCDLSNLNGLCSDCHKSKSKQERKDGKYK